MSRKSSNREIEEEYWTYISDIGDRLRKVRESRGWTLEYCEEMGYTSWRHLREVEAGTKNVSIVTLLRLCKLYGMTLNELLKGIKVKRFKA